MKTRIMMLALAAIAVFAAPSAAVTVNGRLVNGTTGEGLTMPVKVVNAAGGMIDEKEVQAVDGAFVAENLDPNVSVYLLRCDYDGVMYTQALQLDGTDPMNVTFEVYEVEEAAWPDKVNVVVPHLAAMAHEDHMQIEVRYEIHNHAEPARTFAGEKGSFYITLPEDRLEISRSFVAHGDIPLDRLPVPTDQPGVYRIDYPVRPGDTVIGLAYSLPYDGRTYTLEQRAMHAVQSMKVYTVNPGMQVEATGVTLGDREEVHGMVAYAMPPLEAGTEYALAFSGGEVLPAGGGAQGGGGGGGNIVVLPATPGNTTILVMIITLMALLVFLGIGVRGTTNPLDDTDHVRAYYDVLAKRMAKLDDLHAAQTIPADVYKAKREDLKAQLASVMYQLESKDKQGGRKQRPRKARAPRVAGDGSRA